MNANLELLTSTLQFVGIFDDFLCWSTENAPSFKFLLVEVQERLAVDLLIFKDLEVACAQSSKIFLKMLDELFCAPALNFGDRGQLHS